MRRALLRSLSLLACLGVVAVDGARVDAENDNDAAAIDEAPIRTSSSTAALSWSSSPQAMLQAAEKLASKLPSTNANEEEPEDTATSALAKLFKPFGKDQAEIEAEPAAKDKDPSWTPAVSSWGAKKDPSWTAGAKLPAELKKEAERVVVVDPERKAKAMIAVNDYKDALKAAEIKERKQMKEARHAWNERLKIEMKALQPKLLASVKEMYIAKDRAEGDQRLLKDTVKGAASEVNKDVHKVVSGIVMDTTNVERTAVMLASEELLKDTHSMEKQEKQYVEHTKQEVADVTSAGAAYHKESQELVNKAMVKAIKDVGEAKARLVEDVALESQKAVGHLAKADEAAQEEVGHAKDNAWMAKKTQRLAGKIMKKARNCAVAKINAAKSKAQLDILASAQQERLARNKFKTFAKEAFFLKEQAGEKNKAVLAHAAEFAHEKIKEAREQADTRVKKAKKAADKEVADAEAEVEAVEKKADDLLHKKHRVLAKERVAGLKKAQKQAYGNGQEVQEVETRTKVALASAAITNAAAVGQDEEAKVKAPEEDEDPVKAAENKELPERQDTVLTAAVIDATAKAGSPGFTQAALGY